MKNHLLGSKIDEITVRHEANDTAVWDHDSLGMPCRPRRVHHVGKIIRTDRRVDPGGVSQTPPDFPCSAGAGRADQPVRKTDVAGPTAPETGNVDVFRQSLLDKRQT